LGGAVLRADLPTLVAQASALVDGGMGVKDACAQVIAATPGAASRRELYDAVLRSRG
jgi:16S rRNA (cytidine1402-2'-O)-methyltransferase